jgi:molybdate transport system ATP-binding protein
VSLDVCLKRRTGELSVDVEFRVEPGITVLFGPSGAGKSTTLAMIAGLLLPEEGTVRLGGEVWFDSARRLNLPIEHRRVGYVFQSLALFPHLSAADNVAFGVKGASDVRRRVALEQLERFRVRHLADRRPKTFSGGEAQRVALARAFAIEPRLLLLDESFSALDRSLRGELHADVREEVGRAKIPTVLITHDAGDARAVGQQVVLLRGGRVERAGTVNDVSRELGLEDA